MGFSSLRLRPRLVGAMGTRAFQGVYSLIALVVFTALVWFYLTHRHLGPLLWAIQIGPVALWTIYVLQGVAWTLVVAGLIQPSPAMVAGLTGKMPEDIEPRGVQLITRHGAFMGLGLFGLLHLPMNGFLSDAIFFSGFPIFAIVGCWHQDQRKLATDGEAFRAFHAATPFLPFTGAGALRGIREMPLAIVIGVALTVGLRLLHGPFWRS